MIPNLTWEEATEARLREAIQARDAGANDLEYQTRFARALQEVLELDRARRGIKINGQHTVDPQSLLKRPIRESLVEIAAKNRGILIASQACSILVDAGVYPTREAARATVYSVLNRSKKDFRRERPGVYRLVTSSPIPLPLVD